MANIGGFLNRRADALLMGLFFGPVVVGIYRLADRLVDVVLELTMRPVGAISLPHFSRLQTDPEALRQGVRSCMRVAVLATVPAMLVIAACSDYVLAVFGQEWEPGGVALKLLAIVGIAKALVFFSGPLLFALARPGFRALMLWVLAGASAATVVLVAMPLQGEPESDQLLGMAASRAVLFVLVVIPVNLAIIARLTGLTFKQLLHGTPVPLVAGLLAVGAVAGSAGTRAARPRATDPGADHHAGVGDCDHARRPAAARRLGTARVRGCRPGVRPSSFAEHGPTLTRARHDRIVRAMTGVLLQIPARWLPSVSPRPGRTLSARRAGRGLGWWRESSETRACSSASG